MTGDLMNKVFGDIKAKSLSDETLRIKPKPLIDETLMIKDEALRIKLIDDAVSAADNKRMIGVWSPTIAAAMWYLKSTTPRFSISEVASHYIEEGLERDYPELVQKIRERMKR